MTWTLSRRAVLGACVSLMCGCSPSSARTEDARQEKSRPPRAEPPVINHVAPRRDSIGPAPTRFEWTSVAGVERYSFGLWNEADTLIWRQSGLHETFVERPKELELEPGTYFWSVTGERESRPIASSGLSAFVVMPPQ